MNKIIQVINTMITNLEKITNVIVSKDDEFFFIYNNKHKWSIIQNEHNQSISLFLYPEKDIKLEQLAFDVDFNEYKKFITYDSEDFKSKEVIESFEELMSIVKNKIYGVDDILDDILGE